MRCVKFLNILLGYLKNVELFVHKLKKEKSTFMDLILLSILF